MYSENFIIKDLDVLTEHFIPSRILHRDSQITAIRDDISPILKGKPARNIFLYGPPGTGKTCLSKFIVEELKSNTSLLTSYINCWTSSSEFKILYNILHDFGQIFVHRKGIPSDELLDQIKSRLKKPSIVILDEADHLEDSKILYELLGLGISLILIANKETALHNFEERVRSRIASADNIEFQAYKNNEILDILKDRREWGLIPHTVSNPLLEKISSTANGDSRFAIDILRIVSLEAEKNNLDKIPDSYIDKFISKAKSEKETNILENLNEHQKLMYNIIKQNKEIKPQDLYREFNEKSQQAGLDPIVDRTIRTHMEKLMESKLIKYKGEGKARAYSIC